HPESAERDEGSQNANRPAISSSFAVFAAQDDAARETITAYAVSRSSRRPGGWEARRLITADLYRSSRSYLSSPSYSSYRSPAEAAARSAAAFAAVSAVRCSASRSPTAGGCE